MSSPTPHTAGREERETMTVTSVLYSRPVNTYLVLRYYKERLKST